MTACSGYPPRVALEGLVRRLESWESGGAVAGAVAARRDALARYREADRAAQEDLARSLAAGSGPGIHPAQVMAAVGGVFGRDAIYVTDGGNTSLWAGVDLPSTRPRSYLSILQLGMLGTGIPSAVGAILGSPSRDVVCVTGDGAAGFHFMEMQTAARERLPLTAVVCAEGAWTMEEPNELLRWGRTFGTAMGDVRWDRVAEGLGWAGFRVERPEDLEPAIAKARAADGPAVVRVRTSHEGNRAVPPELVQRLVEVYQGPMG